MAIKKKLIHFNSFVAFKSKKLSANKENTKYIDPGTQSERDGEPEILFQSICYIKDVKQIWTHGTYFNTGHGYIETTYSELRTLWNQGKLIPEQEYAICDYTALFHPSYLTTSAGHIFSVIVKASSNSTFYAEARADQSKLDVDKYFSKSDLSQWKIWYDLSGSYYTGPVPHGGHRGVIYRMIDEFGNEANYDFKNATFDMYPNRYQYGSSKRTFYTFSRVDSTTITDLYITGNDSTI